MDKRRMSFLLLSAQFWSSCHGISAAAHQNRISPATRSATAAHRSGVIAEHMRYDTFVDSRAARDSARRASNIQSRQAALARWKAQAAVFCNRGKSAEAGLSRTICAHVRWPFGDPGPPGRDLRRTVTRTQRRQTWKLPPAALPPILHFSSFFLTSNCCNWEILPWTTVTHWRWARL